MVVSSARARQTNAKRLSSPPRNPRSSGARPGLVLPLGLALAAGGLVWLWRAIGGREELLPAAPPPASTPSPASSGAPEEPAALELLRDPLPDDTAGTADVLLPEATLVLRARAAPEGVFVPELTARLTSDAGVVAAEGALAPGAELVLAVPSGTYALGAESAARDWGARARRLELGAGERRVLELVPLRRLTLAGEVLDAAGRPVNGLPLTLFRDAVAETRASTGAVAGDFAFRGVLEGPVELVLGDPAGPIARTAQELGPDTPRLTLEVPELFEVEFAVVDQVGSPVVGARIEGQGSGGGRVAAESDAEGRAQAGFLPAGDYRLFATHASAGRGNRIVEIGPTHEGPIEMRLLLERPPR